jgi:hypothetical protein
MRSRVVFEQSGESDFSAAALARGRSYPTSGSMSTHLSPAPLTGGTIL